MVKRQVIRLGGFVTPVFNREREHRAQRIRLGENHGLVHVTDPAVRRVADLHRRLPPLLHRLE